jgi:hypothetical protein
MLGFGVELPAAGDFADFDAAVVCLVGGGELFEGGASFGFVDAEDWISCGVMRFPLVIAVVRLLQEHSSQVLLLDLGHGVGAGEDCVEHFVFAQADVFEEVGLD